MFGFKSALATVISLLYASSVFAAAHAMRTRPPMQIVPLQKGFRAEDISVQPPSYQLNYYGGPVIAQVKIVGVFWSDRVDSQVRSQMADFYSTLVTSPMLDFLSEYNTPNQSINEGSYGGDYVITPNNSSTSLQDSDVQAEIQAQIDAGNLPPADANTLFMVHFPPGVKITMADGSASCVDFCAYHSDFHDANNQAVYYGVLPDFTGGACSQGCGSGSNFDNFTSTASHETIEAITDAQIGDVTGTQLAAPAAWYDPNANMEIGDICQGKSSGAILSSATQTSYVVQGEWSNSRNGCYAGQ